MNFSRANSKKFCASFAAAIVAAACNGAIAIPAFPGAEGFGANAAGGRGGDVYHVTSLADTLTPGTLRYGLRESGFPAAGRTIVFDVGGVIQLNSSSTLDIKNISKVTIAGQTAPSPITIIGNTIQITGSNNKNTNDIIMRYLSVRKGSGSGEDAISIKGSTGTGTTQRIILDHVSGSWSEDEVISVTQRATDVTVQFSMMSEALTNSHAYGALVRPQVDSNVTYSHNLFSNQKSRNPRPGSYNGKTLNFEFNNNVVYNWSDRAGYIAGADSNVQPLNMNYAGNYLIAGPVTVGTDKRTTAFIKENNSHPLNVKVWQEGNKIDSIAGPTRDGVDTGWAMFRNLNGSTMSAWSEADKMAAQFGFAMTAIDSADEAYARVISSVGAFPYNRDATDTRLINDVLNYTGFAPVTAPPASEWNALLATPQTSRPPGWDTDNDGMPNYWELERGTNPNVADNNVFTSNGYTNLENYLNELTFIANWNLNADGDWSQHLNWRGERPNFNLAAANFIPGITANRTINVDMSVSLARLNFDSPSFGYTLAGAQTITMDVITGFATVAVASGDHTISAPMALADDTRFAIGPNSSLTLTNSLSAAGKNITKVGGGTLHLPNVRAASLSVNDGKVAVNAGGGNAGTSKVQALTIAGGTTPTATLDLADHSIIVGASTSPALLQSQINHARHGGAWDQHGITSSAAAAHPSRATTLGLLSGAEYSSVGGNGTFAGQSYLSDDTLIKYTYYGDTDLNGVVNFDDYSRIDNGFLNNRTGWLNGDFDANGSINFDDYALIDLAYLTQSGTLERGIAWLDGSDPSDDGMNGPALALVKIHAQQFGTPYVNSLLSAVPEPAGAATIGVAMFGMLSSRRRRRR